MWITIYCDASFRGEETGWGCWIKSPTCRIVKSGTSTGPSCSASAEMLAALESIKLALLNHEEKIEGILLNSDCLCVVENLNFKNHQKTTKNTKIMEYKTQILQLIQSRNIKIRTKHVKGHQKDKSIRTYLNNQVDKISRPSK